MNQLALKPSAGNVSFRKDLKRIKTLFRQNRFGDAKPICDKVFALQLRSPEFLHLYGLTLRACNDLKGALEKIHAAHELNPDDAKIINSLGLVFLDLEDAETAATLFKRATSADQTFYQAWINLGNTLIRLDRFDAAGLAFSCAHHLKPAILEPLFSLALLECEKRDYKRAAEMLDELLNSHPAVTPVVNLRRLQVAKILEDMEYVAQNMDAIDRAALSNEDLASLDRARSEYHVVLDQFDEAIAILEEAAARKGKSQPDLIAHLGYCYGEAGRIDEGIATIKELLKEHPDHDAARYNLSFLQFKAGEISEGFENYEKRWRFRAFPSKRRTFDAPTWQGEPIEGKNILVWREQGIGDEVRYASLIPELRERGCSVTFECKQKLTLLWKSSFPWAEIRPEGEVVCVNDPDYAKFDFQIPIGNLGGIFRNSIADFDEKQRPWIARDHKAENRIRSQIAVDRDELLVGVCWRSINQITSRSKVFPDCRQLKAFKDLPNARWLNLQYSSTKAEIDTIRKCGLDLHHYTNLDQKDDLVGARNLIGACDLVISVGGSVGDLAGGIGVPMVYMTRELSEAFLGTDHVPWFVNCKSYPIAAFKSHETIARIAKDWPSISNWAEDLKPGSRKSAASTAISGAALDLEYAIDGAEQT